MRCRDLAQVIDKLRWQRGHRHLGIGPFIHTVGRWRDEQKAGKLPGADIFIGDRGIGVMKGAPPLNMADEQVYRPSTPDEARAAVREMATRHPDMLKIWQAKSAK